MREDIAFPRLIRNVNLLTSAVISRERASPHARARAHANSFNDCEQARIAFFPGRGTWIIVGKVVESRIAAQLPSRRGGFNFLNYSHYYVTFDVRENSTDGIFPPWVYPARRYVPRINCVERGPPVISS